MPGIRNCMCNMVSEQDHCSRTKQGAILRHGMCSELACTHHSNEGPTALPLNASTGKHANTLIEGIAIDTSFAGTGGPAASAETGRRPAASGAAAAFSGDSGRARSRRGGAASAAGGGGGSIRVRLPAGLGGSGGDNDGTSRCGPCPLCDRTSVTAA